MKLGEDIFGAVMTSLGVCGGKGRVMWLEVTHQLLTLTKEKDFSDSSEQQGIILDGGQKAGRWCCY